MFELFISYCRSRGDGNPARDKAAEICSAGQHSCLIGSERCSLWQTDFATPLPHPMFHSSTFRSIGMLRYPQHPITPARQHPTVVPVETGTQPFNNPRISLIITNQYKCSTQASMLRSCFTFPLSLSIGMLRYPSTPARIQAM
jgi:hypothetical protein